jgi:diguanylate cyclase (GGDEF)-like protein
VSQAQARILVADDEPNLREALRMLLERNSFTVLTAVDGQEAVEIAQREQPDLVVLDVMMPRLDGYAACRQLRAHYRTRHIPIVMLTAKLEEDDQITGLAGGANDYVAKPWKSRELVQRIQNHLAWARTQRAVSPLTGLPGNLSIVAERERRVEAGEGFAVMFIDLDNFKAFNDRYGFPRGDRAITAVAEVLVEVIEGKGRVGDFVGHIGGDDFVVITTPDRAEAVCARTIAAFDALAPLYYDAETRARGYIDAHDRQGRPMRFPFVSLSIAVVGNGQQAILHLAEVAQRAIELKKRAKDLVGSAYVIEK